MSPVLLQRLTTSRLPLSRSRRMVTLANRRTATRGSVMRGQLVEKCHIVSSESNRAVSDRRLRLAAPRDRSTGGDRDAGWPLRQAEMLQPKRRLNHLENASARRMRSSNRYASSTRTQLINRAFLSSAIGRPVGTEPDRERPRPRIPCPRTRPVRPRHCPHGVCAANVGAQRPARTTRAPVC